MTLPVVAIVGRANVGKSTLVNRLVGRRAAIEHPEPGVTRDRQGYDVEWRGVRFTLLDTGGWEPRARGIGAKVAEQARRGAAAADVVLLVVDAQTGVIEDDLVVARNLRRSVAPVLVVANKVDTAAIERETTGLERLGFGEPLAVSALHGRASGELLDRVVAVLRETGAAVRAPGEDGAGEVRVAIVGRPNVGKSSLFNRLAADERSIVDEVPGTTRDAVDTIVMVEGRRYRFVDTAGMRRKARRAEGPEYYGLVRSLRAVDEAEVVLIVLDAADGATEQEQKIARTVADAGRAAVLVVNKWDLVAGEEAEDVAEGIRSTLRFVSWAPLVRVSAVTGRGLARIVPAIDSVRAAWERRVPTAEINTWLREATERVPLGFAGPRPLRVRYATQARTRPPEIVLFANGDVGPGTLRAFERRLRDRFDFEGTPVRFTVRRRSR